MIKIAFMTGARKIIRIEITGKILRYFDDVWPSGVQMMPKDQNIIERLLRSGKPNLKQLAFEFIKDNSGESLKEYEKCCLEANPEEPLAAMVRRDAGLKGLMEVGVK
jgi:hypothetical protein